MLKKRKNKTKEQLIKELMANKRFQEKMAFTRDKFYPALMDSSKSIDDALSFLGSISTIVMESFLEFMKDKKFSELNLTDKLDKKDEKYEELVDLLTLFNDMNVFDAKDLIEGMKREVQLFCNEEMKTRQLSSLKTKWIDEL